MWFKVALVNLCNACLTNDLENENRQLCHGLSRSPFFKHSSSGLLCSYRVATRSIIERYYIEKSDRSSRLKRSVVNIVQRLREYTHLKNLRFTNSQRLIDFDVLWSQRYTGFSLFNVNPYLTFDATCFEFHPLIWLHGACDSFTFMTYRFPLAKCSTISSNQSVYQTCTNHLQ